jgi:hypothetical protein
MRLGRGGRLRLSKAPPGTAGRFTRDEANDSTCVSHVKCCRLRDDHVDEALSAYHRFTRASVATTSVIPCFFPLFLISRIDNISDYTAKLS